ncbi:MAG: site-specific integrase [Prevotellaceae bacterium]|jgi:integrase|nr:site-specific integrase [Prevotellaceae bacterium]
MATFKILVLRDNKKRDGSMPVAVQLTHNRQRRYLPTPHVVFAPQLDRSGNIKDPNMKTIADDIYRRVKAIFDELSFRVAAYSADELKEYVARKLQGTEERGVDFFEFAESYIEKIRKLQLGTAKNHRVMLNNLERYVGGRRLNITEVTSRFLYKYQQWMEVQGGGKGAPLGERGQSLYLGSIRTIFNAAQQEYNDYDKGDIPIPNQPFKRFKVPKARNLKTAEQKALSIAQLRAIRDYAPVAKSDELAHDCFMLSFYLCGMNSVDLYRCSELMEGNMEGNVIRYYRAKVTGQRDDKAEMRVRVEPEALPLVEKYAAKKPDAAFDFCKRYASKSAFNAALNRGLKAVGKAVGIDDLEFYYARHSWATIAANTCNIPVDTIDDCLAHSDSRSIAKKAYIKKDWTKVYNANRIVLDAIR